MQQMPPGMEDPKGQEFEFGPQEDQIFTTLASRMGRVGVVQIILGVLQVAGYTGGFVMMKKEGGALQLGTEIPVALAFLVGGFLLVSAASPFRGIVSTYGNDIGHLMKACDKLALLMTVMIGGFSLASVLWLVSFVLRLVRK